MAERNRNTLKSYFNTGDRPTEEEFADLIDSAVNKNEDKASLAEAEAGADNDKYVTPRGVKRACANLVPSATKTREGIVEISTLAEAEEGTDNERAVTPRGAKRSAQMFAPVQSVNGQVGDVVIETGGADEDSGWQTPSLENGINDLGGTYQVARFRKKNGVVFIEGFVSGGTPSGGLTTIFRLPSGFRPSGRLSFVNIRQGAGLIGGNVGRIDILSNGRLRCYAYTASGVSISGISFLVD